MWYIYVAKSNHRNYHICIVHLVLLAMSHCNEQKQIYNLQIGDTTQAKHTALTNVTGSANRNYETIRVRGDQLSIIYMTLVLSKDSIGWIQFFTGVLVEKHLFIIFPLLGHLTLTIMTQKLFAEL